MDQVNPLLRLPPMDAGAMQRGYVIRATNGVALRSERPVCEGRVCAE